MAWYLCPYKVHARGPQHRYCAMNDFTALIRSDGGRWEEIEILDPAIGRCLVKVVGASAGTLTTINAAPGFVRIPLDAMDNPLSSLSAAQRTAVRNQVLACGYTTEEVNARFPNLASNTIGDVLRFLATRKRRARYNAPTQTIVCDGPELPCGDVDALDGRLT